LYFVQLFVDVLKVLLDLFTESESHKIPRGSLRTMCENELRANYVIRVTGLMCLRGGISAVTGIGRGTLPGVVTAASCIFRCPTRIALRWRTRWCRRGSGTKFTNKEHESIGIRPNVL
jgi:hypothetical protein